MKEFTEEQIEQIAKTCHAATVAYAETMGDFSYQPWEASAPYVRTACISGVRFALDHPDVTPEQLHTQWCVGLYERGWTKGEYKSAADKRHPNLGPYEDLPVEQRFKDHLFQAIVSSFR